MFLFDPKGFKFTTIYFLVRRFLSERCTHANGGGALLDRKTDSGDRGNHPSCPQRSVMELLGQILIQPEIGKVCEVVSILQGGILA